MVKHASRGAAETDYKKMWARSNKSCHIQRRCFPSGAFQGYGDGSRVLDFSAWKSLLQNRHHPQLNRKLYASTDKDVSCRRIWHPDPENLRTVHSMLYPWWPRFMGKLFAKYMSPLTQPHLIEQGAVGAYENLANNFQNKDLQALLETCSPVARLVFEDIFKRYESAGLSWELNFQKVIKSTFAGASLLVYKPSEQCQPLSELHASPAFGWIGDMSSMFPTPDHSFSLVCWVWVEADEQIKMFDNGEKFHSSKGGTQTHILKFQTPLTPGWIDPSFYPSWQLVDIDFMVKVACLDITDYIDEDRAKNGKYDRKVPAFTLYKASEDVTVTDIWGVVI